jgi:hypothetical protein
VVEVERRGQQHVIARVCDGEHRIHEREVAAGRDDDRAARRDVDAVLVAQPVSQRIDERRQALDRAVAHHPLTERNRAGCVGDPAADDGNHRRLDGSKAEGVGAVFHRFGEMGARGL